MNQTVILAILGLVVAAVLVSPLLRRGSGVLPPESKAEGLPPDAGPDELAELELDRAMGRISEQDYVRLRDRLEAAASAAQGVAEPEPEPELRAVASAPSERAEDLVRRWREAPRPQCPSCGERPEAEARYCSRCGAGLA